MSPLLLNPADFCFEMLPRLHPLHFLCCGLHSRFPIRPPSYPRLLLGLQGLPTAGQIRQPALLGSSEPASPPLSMQLRLLLSPPRVPAVPVPAGLALPFLLLMPSSASSLDFSFPLWIEPHLCLPLEATSSRKPSLRLEAQVDFSVLTSPEHCVLL